MPNLLVGDHNASISCPPYGGHGEGSWPSEINSIYLTPAGKPRQVMTAFLPTFVRRQHGIT